MPTARPLCTAPMPSAASDHPTITAAQAHGGITSPTRVLPAKNPSTIEIARVASATDTAASASPTPTRILGSAVAPLAVVVVIAIFTPSLTPTRQYARVGARDVDVAS